jgi:hypothetical protein
MKLRSFLPALLLALPLSLLTPVLQAADRWYEVEVLVFSHLNADVNAEKWPSNDSITLTLDGAVPAPNTIATPMAGTAHAPSAQELLRLAAVPAAQYKLLDSYKSLARSRNYRPLLHTSWRQPIGTGKNNFKVRLAGGKDYASRYGLQGKLLSSGDEPANEGLWEVDGYIRLSASRFLHAETELLFRRPSVTAGATAIAPAAIAPTAPPATTAATPATGSNLTWQTDAGVIADEDWLQFYKFNQSRRLKSNELHYFDHPMFGLMIVLRPLEPERAGDGETE